MKKLIAFGFMILMSFYSKAQYDYYDNYGSDRYFYDDNFDWRWDVRVRISDGIRSGLLTNREANMLYSNLQNIEEKEYAYQSDGIFTNYEQQDIWNDVVWLNNQLGLQLSDYDRRWYGYAGITINGYLPWYSGGRYDFFRFDKRGFGNTRLGYVNRNYYPQNNYYLRNRYNYGKSYPYYGKNNLGRRNYDNDDRYKNQGDRKNYDNFRNGNQDRTSQGNRQKGGYGNQGNTNQGGRNNGGNPYRGNQGNTNQGGRNYGGNPYGGNQGNTNQGGNSSNGNQGGRVLGGNESRSNGGGFSQGESRKNGEYTQNGASRNNSQSNSQSNSNAERNERRR